MRFDNCNRKMSKLYTSTFVMKNIQNILLLNGEVIRSSYYKKKFLHKWGNKHWGDWYVDSKEKTEIQL